MRIEKSRFTTIEMGQAKEVIILFSRLNSKSKIIEEFHEVMSSTIGD